HVLGAGPRPRAPDRLHRVHVIRPLTDQRRAVPPLPEHAGDDRRDCARAGNRGPLESVAERTAGAGRGYALRRRAGRPPSPRRRRRHVQAPERRDDLAAHDRPQRPIFAKPLDHDSHGVDSFSKRYADDSCGTEVAAFLGPSRGCTVTTFGIAWAQTPATAPP